MPRVRYGRKAFRGLGLLVTTRLLLARLLLTPLGLTALASLTLGLGLQACTGSVDTASQAKQSVSVAVATNFEGAMRALEPAFETQSGYALQISYGSSGKLYAQIKAGAPYDVFLSADQKRADALFEEIVSGTLLLGQADTPPFTYALGQLALLSSFKPNPEPGSGIDLFEILKSGAYKRLAVANPDLAPYGEAALEVLKTLEIYPDVKSKIVTGENVGQTFTLVATGNAELGIIAVSQMGRAPKGTTQTIPQALYRPIAQDAVSLRTTPASQAFIRYLKSEPAKALIRDAGYKTP